MHARNMLLLLLILSAALSGCVRTGKDARPPPSCPEPPNPPPALMTPPDYENRLRLELFESGPSVTPTSGDSSL